MSHAGTLTPRRSDAWPPESRFFADGGEHRLFGSYNEALEWCENQLLTHHEVGAGSTPSFENWLMSEFGGATDISRIVPFLERHELEVGGFLFVKATLPTRWSFLRRAASPLPSMTSRDTRSAADAWLGTRWWVRWVLSASFAHGDGDRRRADGRLSADAGLFQQDAGGGSCGCDSRLELPVRDLSLL